MDNQDHLIGGIILTLSILAILAVPVIAYFEVRKERRNGR